MKKHTKFSIALVGSTLLGNSPTTLADNPFAPKSPPANDSFLSKLGGPSADLMIARSTLTYKQGFRETRAGSSGGTTTTTPPTSTGETSPPSSTPDAKASASPPPTTGTETPPVTETPDPGTSPPETSASGTVGTEQPSTGETGTSPTTSASGGPPVMSTLGFAGLKEHYAVGETVNVAASISPESQNATGKVDLWVAITIPNVPDLIFFTGTAQQPQFSLEPQPFLRAVSVTESSYPVLVFPVPPGIGGTYTFYALLVERGKNPLEGLMYNRSNLPIQVTTLDN
jgi:hypothetical protein